MGVRFGDDFAEILVAGEVAREQPHVAGLLFGALLVHRGQLVLVNEVDLAAEERLDAVLLRLLEEAREPVEDAVVGDGERLHPQLRRPLAELIRPAAPVQQTVVSMDVEVDEFGIFGGHGMARLRPQFGNASRSYFLENFPGKIRVLLGKY